MKFVIRDRKTPYSSPYPTLVIRGGEGCKNLRQVQRIWKWLIAHEATRQDTLICVGGGSISDLGGFAAATYKRGMKWEVVPTTLLSMVDASIGGKTGIDYEGYKNMIGAIYPPKKNHTHAHYLDTLSREDWLSGMAEVVKTALLADEQCYADALQCYEAETIGQALIERIRAIKADIVRHDPKEKGMRKQLNLGHTVGHALEQMSWNQHAPIAHGWAVMQGLVAEAYLSVVLLGLDREVLRQLSHVMVQYYGHVPCTYCKDEDALMALMRQDKKNQSAEAIHFTLLSAVGQPQINQVAEEGLIRESLEYLFSL